MAVNPDGSFIEVTRTGYFSHISGSFRGIGTGVVMLLAAIGLMWWNEGRAVRTGDAIGEAQREAVAMLSDTSVDPAFKGRLVHVSGRAETAETLVGPDFGVTVPALKLSRKVEYYQWVESAKSETKKKVSGGAETVTSYTCEPRWTPGPVESAGFKTRKATGTRCWFRAWTTSSGRRRPSAWTRTVCRSSRSGPFPARGTSPRSFPQHCCGNWAGIACASAGRVGGPGPRR